MRRFQTALLMILGMSLGTFRDRSLAAAGIWHEYPLLEDYPSGAVPSPRLNTAFPGLSASGVHELNLNIQARSLVDQADDARARLAIIIRDADAAGLTVKAWLNLDRSDGIWVSETTLPAFRSLLERFVQWIEAEALPVRWVVFDLEPHVEISETLLALAGRVARGNAFAALELASLMGRNLTTPAAFRRSARQLGELVDFLHAHGIKAQATTWPLALWDFSRGGTRIQDLMDTPIMVPGVAIRWDRVTFMVYRSMVRRLFSPRLIDLVGRKAVYHFGVDAGLELGIVGENPFLVEPGYLTAEGLRADFAAAKAADVRHVGIYSLWGIDSVEPDCALQGDCPWLPLGQPPSRPGPTFATVMMDVALNLLAYWLEVLGPRDPK